MVFPSLTLFLGKHCTIGLNITHKFNGSIIHAFGGAQVVLGCSHYSVIKISLLFVPCWKWMTIVLVTLTVEIMVTCYMVVVNL
jgi:hypothetical protein